MIKPCKALCKASCTSRLCVLGMFSLYISVSGQPLNQQAEMFACGKDYCPRWGYYTCISSEGNDYCLPCDHDQLQDHCGTQKEFPGCNLYCTEKVTQAVAEHLNESFKHSTETMTEELNASLQDVSNLRSQNEALLKEKSFKESPMNTCQQLKIALIIVSSILLLVAIILVVTFILLCRRKRDTTRIDVENKNMSDFSANKETSKSVIATKKTCSTPSISEAEEAKETENLLKENYMQNQNNTNDDVKCCNRQDGCRDQRLNSVPPTSGPGNEPEKHKIAIN